MFCDGAAKIQVLSPVDFSQIGKFTSLGCNFLLRINIEWVFASTPPVLETLAS
jgi:hypothetical protein